ncbi:MULTISPECIES: O-methyltransferase [Pseudomonas]|uniref:O-methyltransferase n=1 Tax=Pseudomonas TaxID=286 RepID=UPI0003B9C78B|nr:MULTISPECIES: O-methyltransferase [Pseudomonas]EKQ6362455.1 hypothetical protein [Pseudomonas aeruginosa]ERY42342.1 hypothetical protein Q059_04257 [Pseudomonas aeruginosa BL05]MBG4635279.1 hypothetical protein [Pseudomonas aeruginosa]MBG4857591.1 hypothetical protein [Pseudomonas aeruginosa]MBG4893988.1 hypothetical protein [Pseudomonas aeruginosa]
MTAENIPYHLRQNKAVERNLFVDLLSRVNRFRNISSYRYISMGGPFLEDFKLLHSQLRMSDFVCLEINQDVHKRQEFNKPFSSLKLINSSTGDYITNSTFEDAPYVIWLDYAAPKQLLSQLNEFNSLISKLKPYDIVKITLNANISTLGCSGAGEALWEERLSKLKSRMGSYAPTNMTTDDLRHDYTTQLLQALRTASIRALRGRPNERFTPLTSFTYKDSNHKMLTLTGIILPTNRGTSETKEQKIGNFFKITRLMKWKYSNLKWSNPKDISLPDLSARERLFLEPLLSEDKSNGFILHKQLGFKIEEKAKDSVNLLNNFNEYYRHLPWYTKATI